LCDCDCGETTLAVGWALKRGIRKACNNNIHKKRKRNWKGCGDLSASLFRTYKNSAKQRDIPFDISIEDAWQQFVAQEGRCALTGITLTMETDLTHHRDTHTASIDRIKSAAGYTPDNVQWVHKTINAMKWQLPEEEFVHWCRLVAVHAKEKYL
jgi:hypothetical protein